MAGKRSARNNTGHEAKETAIAGRTLRAFVAGLVRVCGEIGLLQYDIACEFKPRAGKGFATVTAGLNRIKGAGVVEDIVPVLMRGTGTTGESRPKDKMMNEDGGNGQGKTDTSARRSRRRGNRP